MHKGIILLVKAGNKEEAIKETNHFMEQYKDSVWDWWVIGGRWNNTLAPMLLPFEEKVKHILTPETVNGFSFLSSKQVEEKQEELQKAWVEAGGEGPNPYSNHYDLPHEGNAYDVMPLSSCLDVVKEWQQDVKAAQEAEEEAKKWLSWKKDEDSEPITDYGMYGYALSKAAHLYKQDFCFDCNVFNTHNYNYSIPEDVENYYAVMVDIHKGTNLYPDMLNTVPIR